MRPAAQYSDPLLEIYPASIDILALIVVEAQCLAEGIPPQTQRA
jgi:hypothetical protein